MPTQLNFLNIKTPSYIVDCFIEVTNYSFSFPWDVPDEVNGVFLELGAFEYGSDSTEEFVTYPAQLDITFSPIAGAFDYVWLFLLSKKTTAIKVIRKTLSGVPIDDLTTPFFSGVVEPSSVKADVVSNTIKLTFLGSEHQQRDLDSSVNPYSYQLPNEPTGLGNNGYYPIEFVFRDLLAQHLYTEYYRFDSNSTIKNSFTQDGHLRYSTLTGTRNITGIVDYLAIWNRFFFTALSTPASEQPKTVNEVLSLIAKNFGCRAVFLPNNEVYLQQRWRNPSTSIVELNPDDIVEIEPSVVFPKEGVRMQLYSLRHNYHSNEGDQLGGITISDIGNVAVKNVTGDLVNPDQVEVIPMVFTDTQYYTPSSSPDITFKGIVNSSNDLAHIGINYNNKADFPPNNFSDHADVNSSLWQLVGNRISEEITSPRMQWEVTLNGVNWDLKHDYKLNVPTLIADNSLIYRALKVSIDLLQNTTKLTILSYKPEFILG